MPSSEAKVLLVEDDALAQKIAKIIFKQLNCEIDLAASGAEAIKLSQEYAYDFILMDIGLKDMDGFTVAEHIKCHEKNACTPIIALTAHDEAFIKEQADKSGITQILAKPLSIESGGKLLDKFLSK